MIATPAQRLKLLQQTHPAVIGSLSARDDSQAAVRQLLENEIAAETTRNHDLFDGEDMSRVGYLPTPEDIAMACATIRSEWTLSEKRRRFVGELMPDEPESVWRPPVIDTSLFNITVGQGSFDTGC